MKGELTAVIEPAPEGGFWAICLEIPGANGQGESIEEAKQDLQAAIELLLEDREADISRGLPPDAMRMPLQIGWNAAIWSGGFAWLAASSKEKVLHIPSGSIPPPAWRKLYPDTTKSRNPWPGRSLPASALVDSAADQGSTMQRLSMVKRLAHDRITPPIANLNFLRPPDQQIQGESHRAETAHFTDLG